MSLNSSPQLRLSSTSEELHLADTCDSTVAELRTVFTLRTVPWLAQAASITASTLEAVQTSKVSDRTKTAIQQLCQRTKALLLALKDSTPDRRKGPLENSVQACVTILSEIHTKTSSASNLLRPQMITNREDQIRRDVKRCHKEITNCALFARISFWGLDTQVQASDVQGKGDYEMTMSRLANLANQETSANLSPEVELHIKRWSMIADDPSVSPKASTDDSSTIVSDFLSEEPSVGSDITSDCPSRIGSDDKQPLRQVKFMDPPPACRDSMDQVDSPSVLITPPTFEAHKAESLLLPFYHSPRDIANLNVTKRSSSAQGIAGEDKRMNHRPSQESPAGRSLTDAENATCTFIPPDLTNEIDFPLGVTPVAHGGYADIWQAEWVRSHCTEKVAVKALRIRADDRNGDLKIKRRLRREVRVWKQLQHPNVLSLYGTCSNFGAYMAMVSPWFRNGTAVTYLRDLGPAATTLIRLKLLYETAKGLTYLHSNERQIVHGDLNSVNILVSDKGEACLCDFGLSSIMELAGPSSITSSFCGSMRFMAPELIKPDSNQADENDGEETRLLRRSACTDVYSYGAVAYHLLSDRLPFYSLRHDHQVIIQVCHGTLLSRPPPDNALREAWWKYIQVCCAADPLKRPVMSEVVDVFMGFMSAEKSTVS